MSKTLTTNDTADVLDALLPAQNEYHSLGLALKLSPYEVKAIYTANHRPQDCLREVIIKFLEQAPESRRNWRVIADALASRIVNHQGLSETVKAAHLPATSIVIEPVSDDLAALTGDVPSNISGDGIQLSTVTKTRSHTWTRTGVKTRVQADAAFGAILGTILFYGLVWETAEVQTYRVPAMIIGAAVGAAAGANHGVQVLILGVAFLAVLVVGGWALILVGQMLIFLVKAVATAAGPPETCIPTAFGLLSALTAIPAGIPLGRRNSILTLPVLAIGCIGGGATTGAAVVAIHAAFMGVPIRSTVCLTVVTIVVIVVMLIFWAAVSRVCAPKAVFKVTAVKSTIKVTAVKASFWAAVGTAVMAVSWRTFCAVLEATTLEMELEASGFWIVIGALCGAMATMYDAFPL